MTSVTTQQDRCIRNERKIDNLERRLMEHGERLMKVDIAIEGISKEIMMVKHTQKQILENELKHIPTYDDVFKKDKRNITILITLITAVSTIVSAVLYNLDKVILFIKTCLGGI